MQRSTTAISLPSSQALFEPSRRDLHGDQSRLPWAESIDAMVRLHAHRPP
jgi:hypothetical protein